MTRCIPLKVCWRPSHLSECSRPSAASNLRDSDCQSSASTRRTNLSHPAGAIALTLFLLVLLSLPASAQNFTNVTGTVTDPNGLAYSNATITADLIGGNPSPVNGQAIQGSLTAPLDVNGTFSMTVGSNTVVGGQWRFTVNTAGVPPPLGTGPQNFSVTVTIGGATQSISTNLNAVAPALSHSGSGCGTLPTTPNSRAQVAASTPSGGVGQPCAYALPGDSPTDRPSGEASYTIGVTDIGTSIRETNAAGEAFTIPDGNTSGFVPPVNIGFIIQGGTSTIARTTSSQIRCTPNGALANTCTLTVGGQYILKEDSGFNYTLSVSGDLSSAAPTGCTSGCNYILTLGDDPATRMDTSNNLAVANQGAYMRFYNALSRKLGNACFAVNTAVSSTHVDVGIYSVSGGTGTLQWHTGSVASATTGTKCVTPTAYTMAGGTNFYIAWCSDSAGTALGDISNNTEALNGAGPANTWGLNATDTCTAGVLPATITITNIANQTTRPDVPYVQIAN